MIMGRRAVVDVLSTKWNGDFHRSTPSVELGSDQWGTWLWIEPGTVADTPTGPFAAIPGLRLMPVGEWWSAYVVPSGRPQVRPASLYIGISTPIVRRGRRFEFVDLDLDIEQVADQPAVVLDREEFEDRRHRWSYPPDIVAAAEAACWSVVTAIDAQRPPFDGTSMAWWNRRSLLADGC